MYAKLLAIERGKIVHTNRNRAFVAAFDACLADRFRVELVDGCFTYSDVVLREVVTGQILAHKRHFETPEAAQDWAKVHAVEHHAPEIRATVLEELRAATALMTAANQQSLVSKAAKQAARPVGFAGAVAGAYFLIGVAA